MPLNARPLPIQRAYHFSVRSLSHGAVVLLILFAIVVTGCSQPGVAPPVWQTMPLGTSADFRDLWFIDETHGWIAGGGFDIPGGLVGRTSDGGRTWRFTSGLIGTPAEPRRASVVAVHFFDERRGIIATDTGAILLTSDAGDTWEEADVQRRKRAISSVFFLNVLNFPDDQQGWAAGSQGVLRTQDRGRTWTMLTADEAGNRVSGRAMHFVDEANGWLAGMQASLLHTTDGGVTWSAADLPLTTADRPSFWDVRFVDRVHGWVVGEEGTILATVDGGTTWTKQSTGLPDAHSAPKLERIPRAGGVDVIDAGDRTPGFTIRAVRFVDPLRGWAVGYCAGLGRSLILATTNGGAAWTVEAEIGGEDLNALFMQGRESIWAVGARVREGAQSIYRRPLSAPVTMK